MQLYEEYGASFPDGPGMSNRAPVHNLTYTQALLLLMLCAFMENLVPRGHFLRKLDSAIYFSLHHGAKGIAKVEARNRHYLCSIMEACGFISYAYEW